MSLRALAHLTKRWWLSVTGEAPSSEQDAWAAGYLTSSELALWHQMGPQDRSHAILVTQRFLRLRPQASRFEVAGALLHDVGKVACNLGTGSRVCATLIRPEWIPAFGVFGSLRSKWQTYRDHERIGVEMLERIGSDHATIELLRGQGPAASDLAEADQI
jgi:hypothetical protein